MIIIAFCELSYSAVPSVAIIFGLFPVQIYLGRLKARNGMQYTKLTSRRVHIMSEILAAIKLIKFYAWEMPFYNRIVDIRKREMHLLKVHLIATVFNFMLVLCMPILITLIALIIYWRTGHVVGPVIGFTAASIFNTLRYPLLMSPISINTTSGR